MTRPAPPQISSTLTDDLAPFDAVVLMSFGGPNADEEVLPFLKNVTTGRGIPDERLVEVGEHYYGFGGKSPINEQNIALRQAIEDELRARGSAMPVLWGNRNWHPYLVDVLREAAAETGARRFLAITTSAYSSYSSCRQYREDFALAEATLAEEGIEVSIEKIRQYFDHPGFLAPQVDALLESAESLRAEIGERAPEAPRPHVLFVTHSIPDPMQEASRVRTQGYEAQHRALARGLAEALDAAGVDWPSELVFCSRSGPPESPWLEPDINDRMAELAEAGVPGVVAVPIGFVSDHMEVKFDLDTEARQTAADLGIAYRRSATVGTDRRFVAGLVDLALERAAGVRGEEITPISALGERPLAPGSGACSPECCRGRVERAVTPQWDAAAAES